MLSEMAFHSFGDENPADACMTSNKIIKAVIISSVS